MDSLANLLRQSVAQMARYVVLPGEAEATALALYVAHTYAIDGAHATPYLLVTSPERQSGKTRMLENLELQVAQPWRVTGASEAAMFRKISAEKPTLMLDEIDAIFGTFSERTEPLRGLINAGNRHGACVSRCVGEKSEVQDFSVFCPKVLAGIDIGKKIPETIRDRSIPIRMLRKKGAEQVVRFKFRHVKEECAPLREALDKWALDAVEPLLAAEPELPEELGDRAAEGWEPLLAIADMAGEEWPRKAREAAVKLSGPSEDSDQTYGAQILEAMRAALADDDRITTASLLLAINGDEELPFGGWSDGRGLDARGLSKILHRYGVRPRSVRMPDGSTPKGYLREQMEDIFDRWLPPVGKQPPQAQQAPQPFADAPQSVADSANVADVAAVAPVSGGMGAAAELTVVGDEEAVGCISHRGEPRAGCTYCKKGAAA